MFQEKKSVSTAAVVDTSCTIGAGGCNGSPNQPDDVGIIFFSFFGYVLFAGSVCPLLCGDPL